MGLIVFSQGERQAIQVLALDTMPVVPSRLSAFYNTQVNLLQVSIETFSKESLRLPRKCQVQRKLAPTARTHLEQKVTLRTRYGFISL